ncbi:MAG: Flp family type IVb pilin [Gemmataceae bacterium]
MEDAPLTRQRFFDRVVRFLVADDGPTAVEYAVMLGLILLVCLSAIASIGDPTTSSFSRLVDEGGFGKK